MKNGREFLRLVFSAASHSLDLIRSFRGAFGHISISKKQEAAENWRGRPGSFKAQVGRMLKELGCSDAHRLMVEEDTAVRAGTAGEPTNLLPLCFRTTYDLPYTV